MPASNYLPLTGISRLIIWLAISALLSACSTAPYVIKHAETETSTDTKIYVVSHGWHTGIIIPAEQIQSRLPQLKARFGEIPYLEVGWGDKGFYQSSKITSGIAINAIFWPSESVVHAVAVPDNPNDYFRTSEIHSLCVNSTQYTRLIKFIESSFAKDQQQKLVKLNQGIYGDSQFYQGAGEYHLLNTCNTWTAKGLSSAGLDISPPLKLTANSIMGYLSTYQTTNPAHSCRLATPLSQLDH